MNPFLLDLNIKYDKLVTDHKFFSRDHYLDYKGSMFWIDKIDVIFTQSSLSVTLQRWKDGLTPSVGVYGSKDNFSGFHILFGYISISLSEKMIMRNVRQCQFLRKQSPLLYRFLHQPFVNKNIWICNQEIALLSKSYFQKE